MKGLVARILIAALAIAAARVAYRAGGGADPIAAPPHAPAPEVPRSSRADAYAIDLRLVGALGSARIDAPALAAAPRLGALRTAPIAWAPLAGDAARVALVASLPLGDDAEHDTFDQREAIVIPAPSTVAFHVRIPRGGKLAFAPAALSGSSEALVFTVTLVDARAAEHEVYTRRVAPAEARRWLEASVDLSAFAGHDVELRFKTTAAPATAAEKKAARPATETKDHAKRHPDAKDRKRPEPPGPPVAAWGDPTLLALGPTAVPYNVLWLVIDALRPDAIAALHDAAEDTAAQRAPTPPLDARLPRMDGLAPALDALAARSVRFTHAYSVATSTRSGTLALLGGAPAAELDDGDPVRFYASDPPLVTRALARRGVAMAAFVNNASMIAPGGGGGLDMGFPLLVDHRHRTHDTAEITSGARRWISAHKDERFFVYCHLSSPRDPFEPPPESLARVPPPPKGPSDPSTRLYLGEVAKADDAVGALLAALDEAKLAGDTIVVVTADHGETLSTAHDAKSPIDGASMRFHHATATFEETTRIPLLVALPGVLPPRAITPTVRSLDVAPTLLELEGLEPSPRTRGRSLLPLVRGEPEADPRIVVSEGGGAHAILSDRYRLIAHDTPRAYDELYDREADPGERHDVAREHPDVVAEMKARLAAARANVPIAGSHASLAAPARDTPVIHLRFAGGGRARRIAGAIVVGGQGSPASIRIEAIGAPRESFTVRADRIDLALRTAPDGVVGLDLRVDPPSAPVAWELFLDDQPWRDDRVFTGPYGLTDPAVRRSLATDAAREAASTDAIPAIDPSTDLGLFVTRSRRRANAIGDAAP